MERESECRTAERGGTRSTLCKAPSTWTQYKTLLAKDLKAEFRTKDMVVSMGIYAFLVIVVFGVALSFARPGRSFWKCPAAFCGRSWCSRRCWA